MELNRVESNWSGNQQQTVEMTITCAKQEAIINRKGLDCNSKESRKAYII
jgi:hypothetical protein